MLQYIEQYLNQGEKDRIYEILESIYGRNAAKERFDFIGFGQNQVAFRLKTKIHLVCIKFLISDQIDKFRNLECALLICEAYNIRTNRVIYKDVTCEKIQLPFMITTFLEGTTFELHRYSGIEKQGYFYEFGRYLGRMHNIHNNCFCKSVSTKEAIDLKLYVSQRFFMLHKAMTNEYGIDFIYKNEMEQIFLKLYHTIAFDQITPSLVHRDISETNLIVSDRTFQGLIDFEHACYFDYVWDFVKLQLNLLSKTDTFCEECFWNMYTKIHPLIDVTSVKKRFQIYYLLELMWAVVNDYRREREKYRNLLIKFIHDFR